MQDSTALEYLANEILKLESAPSNAELPDEADIKQLGDYLSNFDVEAKKTGCRGW